MKSQGRVGSQESGRVYSLGIQEHPPKRRIKKEKRRIKKENG